jgi:hypothetical protein
LPAVFQRKAGRFQPEWVADFEWKVQQSSRVILTRNGEFEEPAFFCRRNPSGQSFFAIKHPDKSFSTVEGFAMENL